MHREPTQERIAGRRGSATQTAAGVHDLPRSKTARAASGKGRAEGPPPWGPARPGALGGVGGGTLSPRSARGTPAGPTQAAAGTDPAGQAHTDGGYCVLSLPGGARSACSGPAGLRSG